ncbi:hypothetical protein GpartN1_g5739.t1 [Galdieria partita]|uniref:Uncharacterized protein n=1 Tax=Galdieria partita TaxID=83374 RepID=A0A9C7PZU6_9RHOD|nr:hypothetical protein GpartN1_g5739.t1 [Galdieria partita]
MNPFWGRLVRRRRRLFSRAFLVADVFFLFALFYTLSSGSLYYHRYLHRNNITGHLVVTSRLVALVSSGWGLNHMVDIPNAALNIESITIMKKLLESINLNRKWSERVVISPFMVLKKPDVDKMKLLECPTGSNCTLQFKPLLEVGQAAESLMSLFTDGLIHPEFGGQIGFNARHWIQEMLEGASVMESSSLKHAYALALKCFLEGKVCSSESDQELNEFLYFETELFLMDWIRNGTAAFYEFWKYYPSVLGLNDDNLGPSLIDICRKLGYRGIHLIPFDTPMRSRIYRSIDQRMSILNDIALPTTQNACKQWCLENASKLYDSEYLSIRIPPSLLMDSSSSDGSCLELLIRQLEEKEETIFLTSSELHQILSVGWSMEIWNGYLVLRNFLEEIVTVSILHIDSFNSAWNERQKPILDMLCGHQNVSEPQVKLIEMNAFKFFFVKETGRNSTIYDCRDKLQLESGKSYLLFPM